MSTQIRLAEPADLAVVQSLNHQLFVSDSATTTSLNNNWPFEPEGEKYFRTKIAGEDGVCFVAEVDGEVVGYTAAALLRQSACFTARRAELENIFVAEAHRGQGIGTQLVQAFKDWARQQGAGILLVGAFTPNQRAIAFYQRVGFQPYELVLKLDHSND